MIIKYLTIGMSLLYFFTATMIYIKTVKKLSSFALRQKDLFDD